MITMALKCHHKNIFNKIIVLKKHWRSFTWFLIRLIVTAPLVKKHVTHSTNEQQLGINK
jgi:hypothetical protein